MSIVHIAFYPSDWLAGTRGMSDSETGVYITLIARIYEMAGPIERDDNRLSRLCGCKSKAAFVRSLEYLISEGKIIETEAGLFNERAAKEIEKTIEKSSKAKSAAQSRWDRKPNKNNDGTHANASPKHMPQRCQSEPESDIREDTDVSSRRKPSPLEGFDSFWEIWPSKKNKDAAKKAWRRLSIDDKRAAFLAIRAGWFDRWQAESPDANPIHASTFLNRRRWEDQQSAPHLRPIPGGRAGKEPESGQSIADRIAARFSEMDCGEDPDPSQPLLSAEYPR